MSGRCLMFALSCILTLSACTGKYRDVKITSCGISSLSPSGLKAVDAVLSLGVSNPGPEFEISDLELTLKLAGEPVARFDAESLVLPGKSDSLCPLPVHGDLCEGFNLMSALALIKNPSGMDMTADAVFNVGRKGKKGMKVRLTDRPMTDILTIFR